MKSHPLDKMFNKPKNRSTFDKLKEKIKNDTGLELENFRRNYVGIHMKASGAWCWISKMVGSNTEVGSPTSASDLLKCKKLEYTRGWGFNEFEIIEDESKPDLKK
jgi:hypothetical protein